MPAIVGALHDFLRRTKGRPLTWATATRSNDDGADFAICSDVMRYAGPGVFSNSRKYFNGITDRFK